MLQHYQKFWLQAKLKAVFTSLVTLFSVSSATAPGADVIIDTPVTTTRTITATHSITLNPGFTANGANGTFKAEIVAPPPPVVTPCVMMDALPSQDQNYVVTYTPRIPVTDLSQVSCTADVTESIQYSDGIGRPVQNVQVRGNADASADVVQHIDYDSFGRENKKYLPYADRDYSAGSFRQNAAGLVAGYYALPPSASGVTSIYPAYAETQFESSPLNRAAEQGAPGADWQLSQGHTVKTVYDVNIANDVVFYSADTEGAVDEEYKRNLYSSGYYAAGELYLTITKNENWVATDGKENTAEEYKDKDGRVVLKRTFDAGGAPLSTYYVYDYRGNLCYVLPPKENPDVTKNNITITMLDELCYQYYYDNKNRLVEKKLPGKGWEYMVYNQRDKLVATQDANMLAHANGPWKFIKYDNFDREILTGMISSPVSNDHYLKYTRIELQSEVDQNLNLFETRSAGSDYTNVAWPTSGTLSTLTKNYYDDYNIPGLPAIYDHHTENSQLTKNLATASLSNVFNTSDMLWTVNYYDDFSRLTNIYTQLYYLGPGNLNTGNYDHITNTYNFDNQISTTRREHFLVPGGSASPLITVINNYKYDHMGRKRQTWEQINTNQASGTNIGTTTGANVLLSQVDYNDVGQPIVKHLHSEDNGNTFLQDIACGYNERGWINHIHSTLFDEQLRFNTQAHGAQVKYNGNIAEEETTTLSGSRYFTYAYDNLNRLTSGVSSNGNLSETNIHYDAGGNITQLTRNNNLLNYTYTANTNKLVALSGLINSSLMVYDYNGNLQADYRADKTIEEDYNLLNLPEYIGGSEDMSIFYGADGQKWETENNITGEAREYMRGIQYKVNWPAVAVQLIQTEEGQAVPDGNGGFKYEYTLKDHLGNNRVNFDKDPSTLAARRIQETDYFPFGKSAIVNIFGDKNEYLYNGKELLETLNEYDYGARYYDAEIARWNSIDPLSEQNRRFTPYNYAVNNPIRFIDPDGMNSDDDDLMEWAIGLANSLADSKEDKKSNKTEIASAKQDKEAKVDSKDEAGVSKLGAYLAQAASVNSEQQNTANTELGPGPKLAANKGQSGGNQGQQKGNQWRLPDFLNASFSIPIAAPFLSYTISGNLDRNGNLYLSYFGLSLGKSAVSPYSLSVTANWLAQSEKPTQADMHNFLTGWGESFTGGYWFGGNLFISPGASPHEAYGVGFVTPQGGFTWGYTAEPFKTKLTW